jgi:hypothetical protein
LRLKAATDISLSTGLGAIAVRNLFAGEEIAVSAQGNVSLNGELISDNAGVDVLSASGAVAASGSLIALNGPIQLKAFTSFTQPSVGGLTKLELIAGGTGYSDRVVVRIAEPYRGFARRSMSAGFKISELLPVNEARA